MATHRDLRVWQDAMALVESVYGITADYPPEERFALVSQTRRAAVSVAANLAEGAGRRGLREFRQFAYASLGSLSELDTLLEIAMRTHLVSRGRVAPVRQQLVTVRKLLLGLIRWLDQRMASREPGTGPR